MLPFFQNEIRGFHDLLKENLQTRFMLFGLMQLELNHFLHEPVNAGPWFIVQDVMTNITADYAGVVRCDSSI